jgi:hypothetical protein
MEVRRGLVYPHQTMLSDIQIDMVHDNSRDLKLKMPPDDMTLTMQDAITRRVHWRRISIDTDPSAVASASTTPS